ncbi:uncharacterized mitochondrial protein AtMg00310-like [Rosa rugosa]|uniref:uncharacterized mitochondrial protein AtMg00310-like n=1 Tax=Rosa rugosa TaxID=74645 RepID=UPI002B400974|nr:uncharacterized mitochondrial protein AtMg00310-like [Rosa rugosa]
MALLMCELLGFAEVENPGTYLGLPTIWGKSRKEALVYIKERVNRKLEGWKQRSLSLASREVLKKSVAMAIPTYPMACFKFPNGTCDDINSTIGKFWWGSNHTGRKIHCKSWDFLVTQNQRGGMGFRDLHHFNMALLAK